MNELFHGLVDYVRMYINDLLMINDKILQDHIEKSDEVLSRLKSAGSKVNAEISFIARNELKYLDFKITRQGIMTLPHKVKTIKKIAIPTTKKKMTKFHMFDQLLQRYLET